MRKQKGLFIVGICIWIYSMVVTANASIQKDQERIAVEVVFPDENFRVAVSRQADQNKDGFLSETEIADLTELVVDHPYQQGNQNENYPFHDYDGIRMDVSGIEIFRNLKTLSFQNVEPAGLSIGKLMRLETFCIDTAPEMELDFSGASGLKKIKIINMELKSLNVNHSGVTEIDIYDTEFTRPFHGFAGAGHLRTAWICDTNLEEVDFTSNTKMEWIVIERCDLKKIRLAGLKNLKHLSVRDTELKDIDVSDHKKLKMLSLERNQFTKIDVSRNDKLESLYISGNPFTKIDSTTVKVSDMVPLGLLHAHDLNKCAVLDVSHIQSLQRVYAYSGRFRKVKIGKNLIRMDMVSNKGMTVLDKKTFHAPDGAKLKMLECNKGKLTVLDISHLTKLVYLDAGENRLKKADLSGNLKLGTCILDGNRLEKLVVNSKSTRSQKKMYQTVIKHTGGKMVYKG